MIPAPVWHPLAVSGGPSARMESWACPDDCHAPCPIREAAFWPETRAALAAAIDALPNGRYLMRWTGDGPDITPATPA